MKEGVLRLPNPEQMPAFLVYCKTCDNVLYQANADNFITRYVGNGQGTSHQQSYNDAHDVMVIDFGQKTQ